jgi:hypothetical protein
MWRPHAMGIAALAAAACAGGGEPGVRYDYAASQGAALYQELCASCHGEVGEGGLGPALQDLERSSDDVARIIAERMPKNEPGRCTGACATEVAAFLKEGLSSAALRCDQVPPSPRRLRLLTRREYRATVRDLLGVEAVVACGEQVFTYDPGDRVLTSVHVAGSFNGWAATVATGWPLVFDAGTGVWRGSFGLGDGRHAYKLVLDEREWVADPTAAASEPDGHGGQNSLVTVACDASADVVAAIPAETRPAGFPFDSDADRAVVTTVHVDAYLAAAEALADGAAARLDALHACDWAGDRAGCAASLVQTLGRRIFRRPLTDDELARYAGLVADGATAADGVATALHGLLVSPHFLYRSEVGVAGEGGYRLDGFEIATALAYTFTGSAPDDALLDAAEAGALDDVRGVERWARALVADPRARQQVGELVLQWLGAEAVATADKRPAAFPGFTPAVRAALARETRDFAAHVVFDGSGRLGELFTADYTVVDATAAAFYGLAQTGVAPIDGHRAGLLGHASVLASHAHSDQTSPIRRGLFVRRNLLCQELPPPPAFAGGVPEVDPDATTRERFAMHTSNAVCAGCHRYIDGLGFGFEGFDPVGLWRDREAGQPIDATGALTDVDGIGTGTSASYHTLPELAALLAAAPATSRCFVRQVYRFTRGKRETLNERCARRWLEDGFAASGGDVRELLVQSVLAPDFAVRR